MYWPTKALLLISRMTSSSKTVYVYDIGLILSFIVFDLISYGVILFDVYHA